MPNFSNADYVAIAGLIIPLFVLAVSACRYVNTKKVEQEQQRFENYHELIHKLVRAGSEGIGLDSQKAIIFELRNYREYKEVSIRILESLKIDWGRKEDEKNEDNYQYLFNEIDITISHLEKIKWHEKST